MKNIKRKNVLITMVIIVAILIIFLTSLIFAINTVATGFRVIAGGAIMEIDAWSTCRNVDNNRAEDIFVPTKTSNEWLSFRNYYPSSVYLTACAECTVSADCAAIYVGCAKMICLSGNCCSLLPPAGGCPPICPA